MNLKTAKLLCEVADVLKTVPDGEYNQDSYIRCALGYADNAGIPVRGTNLSDRDFAYLFGTTETVRRAAEKLKLTFTCGTAKHAIVRIEALLDK